MNIRVYKSFSFFFFVKSHNHLSRNRLSVYLESKAFPGQRVHILRDRAKLLSSEDNCQLHHADIAEVDLKVEPHLLVSSSRPTHSTSLTHQDVTRLGEITSARASTFTAFAQANGRSRSDLIISPLRVRLHPNRCDVPDQENKHLPFGFASCSSRERRARHEPRSYLFAGISARKRWRALGFRSSTVSLRAILSVRHGRADLSRIGFSSLQ